ncbi:unnamed protein product [Pipistrellus nathusii]|uniref:Uncharacterized protein n=1 Tax=Pipistrellus nathusii TaxID=59473 RepID=A0ABP0A4X3_PIPNA
MFFFRENHVLSRARHTCADLTPEPRPHTCVRTCARRPADMHPKGQEERQKEAVAAPSSVSPGPGLHSLAGGWEDGAGRGPSSPPRTPASAPRSLRSGSAPEPTPSLLGSHSQVAPVL